MPDHLTIKQFCERAPMGKSRLYEMLKAGKIKAKRDGSTVLIPVEEYETWKASLPDYLGAQMGAQKTG